MHTYNWAYITYLLVGSFGFISGILGVTVIPALFKFWLIPKIERRAGCKLSFSPVVDWYLFGRFFIGYMEVSYYIVIRYLGLKFKKNPNTIKINSNTALAKINYDVATAPKTEVIMSFIAWFNIVYFFLVGTIFYIIKNLL